MNLVSQLCPTPDYVIFELFANRVVERRSFVLFKLLIGDFACTSGGIASTESLPAIPVV